MKGSQKQLAVLFRRQYGVVIRTQVLAAGVPPRQVSRAVNAGTWRRVHTGVYQLAATPWTPQAALLAACLATGGRASHQRRRGCGASWPRLRRSPPSAWWRRGGPGGPGWWYTGSVISRPGRRRRGEGSRARIRPGPWWTWPGW